MAKCIRCGKEKSDRTKTQYCRSCGCIVKRSTPEYIAHLKSRKAPMLGKKHSEETKAKMRGKQAGNKHYKWKGGKPKCMDCGKTLSSYNKTIKRCKPCSLLAQKGKNHPWYGRTHKPETVAKIKATQTGRPRPDLCGENHYLWKGGISPLGSLVRLSISGIAWRKQVFEQDDFTCQDCGKRGGYLMAHHDRAFSEILGEFLQEYSQFSPIDDKETLVRLSETYAPFWDVSNGTTLCKKCHNKLHKIIGKPKSKTNKGVNNGSDKRKL